MNVGECLMTQELADGLLNLEYIALKFIFG